jgi:hypothetical protein
MPQLLGSGLIQTQNAMMAARTTADRKLGTSKNPGRIDDRLIHFVGMETEYWNWATGLF